MSQPLVSVVIPTHNRKDLVCESIDSALAQTYRNTEIIVVDDGSSDGTFAHLAEQYGDRIRIVRRDSPSGCGPAKNAGAAVATGDFLAFLDSDDIWLPNKLRVQMDAMRAHGPEVALVGSSCEYMDLEGQPALKPTRAPKSATYEDFCIRLRLPGSGSNHLIRKAVFDEVGGFDESLTRAQDKDLWIRILEKHEVRYADPITARIRVHNTDRVGIDTDVIIDCRRRIDRKIPDPRLRRKASAWSYFSFFRILWRTDRPRALGFLFRSFLIHPGRLEPGIRRLKPALRILIASIR